MSTMNDILKKNGYLLVDEEGMPWSGFILGRNGKTEFDIAPLATKQSEGAYIPISNAEFQLMWDKTDNNKYIVTAWVA